MTKTRKSKIPKLRIPTPPPTKDHGDKKKYNRKRQEKVEFTEGEYESVDQRCAFILRDPGAHIAVRLINDDGTYEDCQLRYNDLHITISDDDAFIYRPADGSTPYIDYSKKTLGK